MNPDLLIDIQTWHDADEHQKIIDALSALPGSELNYELTCLLARAYNNRGENGDYKQAVSLLLSVADEGIPDPLWHYRLGYAYYFLNREYDARREFEFALRFQPGDEDCLTLIRSCNQALSLPLTLRPFSKRVQKFWKFFLLIEQELRALLDQEADSSTPFAALIIDTVLDGVNCEAIKHGERYELILKPEEHSCLTLPCLALRDAAPPEACVHWTFTVSGYENQKPEPVFRQSTGEEEALTSFRSDIRTGSFLVPELSDEYEAGEQDIAEQYYQHGITACFLCYPVRGKSRAEQEALSDTLITRILGAAGDTAVLIGSAFGTEYDYIDLLVYDLRPFLDSIAAQEQDLPVELLFFQVFRPDIGPIPLKSNQLQEGTVLTRQTEEMLRLLFQNSRLFDALELIRAFIDEGTQAGAFTEEEAYHDLRIALYVAYANNNIDDYEHYISTEKWLRRVEDQATGCGVWYYRYACALIYLSRLEEALEYSEKGIREEADYPWNYLNAAALRSHFGDTEGALRAVETGLALVPEDYEFLRLKDEIKKGSSLEEMEYHYITPEDDAQLASASPDDPRVRRKQKSVAGILCRSNQLARILTALHASAWTADSPYCRFTISPVPVCGDGSTASGDVSDAADSESPKALDACFHMNQAAASKFDPKWAEHFYAALPNLSQTAAEWLTGQLGQEVSAKALTPISVTFEWIHESCIDFRDTESKAVYSVYFTPDLDVDPHRQENYYPELYTGEELEAVSSHIERHFGIISNVLHEIISPDIRIDICVIEPTPERNYYTLVTCGMGAHRMKVPDTVDAARWGRAELLICLPPDWDITGSDETSYWPIRCLKSIARLPGEKDTWISAAHSISYDIPFAQNNWFTGILLLEPQDMDQESGYTTLPNGEEVNFYQLIPLYEEEVRYKLDYGLDRLLEQMKDVSHVVDVTRPNVRIMDIDTMLQ